MSRCACFFFLFAGLLLLLPFRSPAPWYHVPGEGWYYEPFGATNRWIRPHAKEQLAVAEQSFTNGDYIVALHAARRVIREWQFSDYAPRAEFVIGQSLEALHKNEAAFKAYQAIIQKYPNSERFNDVLWKQYGIADKFLNGEWGRLFGYIPFPATMEDTAKLFSTVVTNGPYSEVAPYAQLKIGEAHERQKSQEGYEAAVRAYQLAADRYYNRPQIAADALYREGVAYQKQAAKAEYDQGTAGKAIAAYTDFMTLYPEDPRVPEAQKAIGLLKAEQVAGNFKIAQFYERGHKWAGAVVYYNEVLQLDPNSTYAESARQKIEQLKPRLPRAID